MTHQSVYYAHPKSWYGTDYARADMQRLSLDYETVINPGSIANQIKFDAWKMAPNADRHPMEFFLDLVAGADALAYRTFSDGKIGAGVAQEILHAHLLGKPLIRVYSGACGPVCGAPKLLEHMGQNIDLLYSTLTIEETRDRVKRGIL